MKYLLSYNRIFSGACFDCYFWRRLGDCCCDRCRRNNIGALGDKPNKQIESWERVRESENVPRTTMVDHFDERKMSLSFYWKINESDMISPLFPFLPPPSSRLTFIWICPVLSLVRFRQLIFPRLRSVDPHQISLWWIQNVSALRRLFLCCFVNRRTKHRGK